MATIRDRSRRCSVLLIEIDKIDGYSARIVGDDGGSGGILGHLGAGDPGNYTGYKSRGDSDRDRRGEEFGIYITGMI